MKHLVSLLLLASLAPVNISLAEVGGDDVLMATHTTSATGSFSSNIVATDTGILFATGQQTTFNGNEIFVYRSDDNGQTWDTWSTFSHPLQIIHYSNPSLIVTDGINDRLFLAYHASGFSQSTVRVGYTDALAATPSWTFTDVDVDNLGNHRDLALTSDSKTFNSYYLYFAFTKWNGTGYDMYFARSTDQGSTWETPYAVMSTAGISYTHPDLDYGTRLHLVAQSSNAGDTATRYRNAGFRVLSSGSWNAEIVHGSETDGIDQLNARVAANGSDLSAMVAWNQNENIHWRSTTDAGNTWTPAAVSNGYLLYGLASNSDSYAMAIKPSGILGLYISEPTSSDLQGLWLTTPMIGGPNDWISGSGTAGLSFNPSENEEWMATIWYDPSYAGDPGFYFDGEWRGGPGYPNWETEPINHPSLATTHPALADIDGDNDLEIIYNDITGALKVIQPDATDLPGWPRYFGAATDRARPAVGDVDGGGDNEVVFCDNSGELYLIKSDGTDRANFPVTITTGSAGYVSIGPVSGFSPQDIVVTSANKVMVYNFLGDLMPGFPITVSGVVAGAAAIGDVDLDGANELVVASSQNLYVIGFNGSIESQTNLVDFASGTPSLGNMDLDPELEIAVPTTNGKVHLLEHTGVSKAGWPKVDPGGGVVTQVAVAQMVGTSEQDLAYATSNGVLHGIDPSGTPMMGYPKVFGGPEPISTPLINKFHQTGGWSLLVSDQETIHAWRNMGELSAGYPRSPVGQVDVTPACGDIDLDGSLELVVFSGWYLEVFDVGNEPANDPKYSWNMHGGNAARTNCSDCNPTLVTSVGNNPAPTPQLMFSGASPNPAPGPVTFNYALPREASIELTVFDVQGRKVWQVMKPEHPEGNHTLRWNGQDTWGRDVNPGVYFARMRATGTDFSKVETRKVVVER